MAVPKWDALMLPLLQSASDGREHRLSDAAEHLIQKLRLSDADRAERIPSGQSRLRNRTYWAKLHLSQAKVIDTVSPGVFQITERGRELLARNPTAITTDLLLEYPEYRAFIERSRRKDSSKSRVEPGPDTTETDSTPEDTIQAAYNQLKAAAVNDLLEYVRSAHWTFLEKLIIELLERMNYGESGMGEVLGGIGRHEGGLDGVIQKDRLGLGRIYVQAKRYKDGATVGAPAVEQLAGSMKRHHAEEGVFVTTSTFTDDAKKYVKDIGNKIALIDGQRLAELMYEYGMGVTTVITLEIKRVNAEFFAEG